MAAVELRDDGPWAVPPYLYKAGKVTPLDVGLRTLASTSTMSDISPSCMAMFVSIRSPGQRRCLNPLASDAFSWTWSINDNDEVLGWSWSPGGPERVGVWSKSGVFSTYLAEGTPEFPTLELRPAANSQGLIVITDTDDYNSYIVPRPGVRINLADLTDANFPFYSLIYGVNDNGDMIGVGGPFPLLRVSGIPAPAHLPGALAAAPAQRSRQRRTIRGGSRRSRSCWWRGCAGSAFCPAHRRAARKAA